MVGNRFLHKAGIAVCVGSIMIMSSSASANSREAAEEAPLEAARMLVAEYRELRKTCADLAGDERRSCIHELESYNGQYRVAKQQLKLGKTEDLQNIHLVTF